MEENSQKSTDIKNSQGADYRNSGSRGSGQHNDPKAAIRRRCQISKK